MVGLLTGCDASTTLVVQVRSDLVPGRDFARVEVRVEGPGGDPRIASVDARAQPWGAGVRVAEVGVAPGDYHLEVAALDASGATVVARPVSVDVTGGVRVVTVLLSVACRDVVCPTTGVDASRVACHGGRCVDEACAEESAGSCADPECASPADCVEPAGACASVECTASGTCFDVLDHASCASGEVCGLAGCFDPAGPPCAPAGPVDWIAMPTRPVGTAVGVLPGSNRFAGSVDMGEAAVSFATADLDATVQPPTTIVSDVGAWRIGIQPLPAPNTAMVVVSTSSRSRARQVVVDGSGAGLTGVEVLGQLARNGNGALLSGTPVFIVDEQGVGVPVALVAYPPDRGAGVVRRFAYGSSGPVYLASRSTGGAFLGVATPDGATDHCDVHALDATGATENMLTVATAGACGRIAVAEVAGGGFVVAYSDPSGVSARRYGPDFAPSGGTVSLDGSGGGLLVEAWAGPAGDVRAVWDRAGEVATASVAPDGTVSAVQTFTTTTPGLARAARLGNSTAIGFVSGATFQLAIVCE